MHYSKKILRLFIVFLSFLWSAIYADTLTSEQINFFHQNGYLVIDNYIEPSLCDSLRQRAMELVSQCDPAELMAIHRANQGVISWEEYYLQKEQKICFFFEQEAFNRPSELLFDPLQYIKKISYALHDLDFLFKRFSYSERILDLFIDLGCEKPRLIQSMYLCKQPLIGSEVGCHQDSSFIHSDPDSLIGFWLALDQATTENGCLWVLPGRHHDSLKWKMKKDADGKIGYEVYHEEGWLIEEMTPLEVGKGSVILLHGHLPHMSRANHSIQPRHAYSLHVISSLSSYLSSNWQPLLEK